MTEEEVNEVAVLRRAGNSPAEIAQTINRSYTFVLQAQGRARDIGLLPPRPKPNPRQSARNYVSNRGIIMGHISDVVMALTEKQKAWLILETERLGCATISEYLTELARDEYEKENWS
jgi:hypothetical protein